MCYGKPAIFLDLIVETRQLLIPGRQHEPGKSRAHPGRRRGRPATRRWGLRVVHRRHWPRLLRRGANAHGQRARRLEFAKFGVAFRKIYFAPEAPRSAQPQSEALTANAARRPRRVRDRPRSQLHGRRQGFIECGWNAGKCCVLVRTGYGREHESQPTVIARWPSSIQSPTSPTLRLPKRSDSKRISFKRLGDFGILLRDA